MKGFPNLQKPKMEAKNFEWKKLLHERQFWFASALIAWAAGLKGYMMWVQSQDSFKEKLANLDQTTETEENSSL